MALLRAVVILLAVLNLFAFAGLRGWLGVAGRQGEPERLTNQLHPERILLHRSSSEGKGGKNAAPPVAVVAPAVPSTVPADTRPAKEAPPACGALSAPNAEAAKALSEALGRQQGVTLQEQPLEPPSSWWVHLPPADSRGAAGALVADLRQKGVTDVYIMNESSAYPHAVSLGLFKQAVQADRLLEQLRSRGVAGAKVTPRGSAARRIEVRGSQEAVDKALAQVAGQMPGLEPVGCAP